MIYVCRKCSEIHMAGFLGGVLCTSVYRCIFVCIVVRDCRQSGLTQSMVFWMMFIARLIYYYPVIFVCTDKIYQYGNTQMDCNHLNIHVCANKYNKKVRYFLDLICAGFCSTFACTGYFCLFYLTFILLSQLI